MPLKLHSGLSCRARTRWHAAPIQGQMTCVRFASQLTVGLAGRSCSADTPSTLVAWPGTAMWGEMLGSVLAA
eukprot:6274807-Alexandrium_andersonii.AAC.1